jgi:hypothetical protein
MEKVLTCVEVSDGHLKTPAERPTYGAILDLVGSIRRAVLVDWVGFPMSPPTHMLVVCQSGLGGSQSAESAAYRCMATINCLPLFTQYTPWAVRFARDSTGNNRAARMAMIAMVTSSSIRVKPLRCMSPVRAHTGIAPPKHWRQPGPRISIAAPSLYRGRVGKVNGTRK